MEWGATAAAKSVLGASTSNSNPFPPPIRMEPDLKSIRDVDGGPLPVGWTLSRARACGLVTDTRPRKGQLLPPDVSVPAVEVRKLPVRKEKAKQLGSITMGPNNKWQATVGGETVFVNTKEEAMQEIVHRSAAPGVEQRIKARERCKGPNEPPLITQIMKIPPIGHKADYIENITSQKVINHDFTDGQYFFKIDRHREETLQEIAYSSRALFSGFPRVGIGSKAMAFDPSVGLRPGWEHTQWGRTHPLFDSLDELCLPSNKWGYMPKTTGKSGNQHFSLIRGPAESLQASLNQPIETGAPQGDWHNTMEIQMPLPAMPNLADPATSPPQLKRRPSLNYVDRPTPVNIETPKLPATHPRHFRRYAPADDPRLAFLEDTPPASRPSTQAEQGIKPILKPPKDSQTHRPRLETRDLNAERTGRDQIAYSSSPRNNGKPVQLPQSPPGQRSPLGKRRDPLGRDLTRNVLRPDNKVINLASPRQKLQPGVRSSAWQVLHQAGRPVRTKVPMQTRNAPVPRRRRVSISLSHNTTHYAVEMPEVPPTKPDGSQTART